MKFAKPPFRIYPHAAWAEIHWEIHARPFIRVSSPSRIFHFAFATDPDAAASSLQDINNLAGATGQPAFDETEKQVRLTLDGGQLCVERHGEFLTHTFLLEGSPEPFQPAADSYGGLLTRIRQPGPLLAAVDLHVCRQADAPVAMESLFQGKVIAMAEVDDGLGLIASDFMPDAFGFVRMLIVDRSLTPSSLGALAQQLLEIETYRALALLGLPLARNTSGLIRELESRLPSLMRTIENTRGLDENRRLLDTITCSAAALESVAADSLYRFGATNAYGELVQMRLEAIRETPLPHYPTFRSYLARRFQPALRTCSAMERRQNLLSTKIARAADLLRTRVDIEIESQNGEELRQMAERQRLQLRLQQTVEGLSIAAISYYVVSLLHSLFAGIEHFGSTVEPEVATAASIPFVLAIVAILVRRIRRQHVG